MVFQDRDLSLPGSCHSLRRYLEYESIYNSALGLPVGVRCLGLFLTVQFSFMGFCVNMTVVQCTCVIVNKRGFLTADKIFHYLPENLISATQHMNDAASGIQPGLEPVKVEFSTVM